MMAGKAKFDKEAAFKSIVGIAQEQGDGAGDRAMVSAKKNKNRVQRSYFIDRDLDKALRRKALEEEKKLTEVVNEILRTGLIMYIKN